MSNSHFNVLHCRALWRKLVSWTKRCRSLTGIPSEKASLLEGCNGVVKHDIHRFEFEAEALQFGCVECVIRHSGDIIEAGIHHLCKISILKGDKGFTDQNSNGWSIEMLTWWKWRGPDTGRPSSAPVPVG